MIRTSHETLEILLSINKENQYNWVEFLLVLAVPVVIKTGDQQTVPGVAGWTLQATEGLSVAMGFPG